MMLLLFACTNRLHVLCLCSVHALTGRPVLANGGMFDITEAAEGGVQCIVHSSNPENTAVAIGERLVAR